MLVDADRATGDRARSKDACGNLHRPGAGTQSGAGDEVGAAAALGRGGAEHAREHGVGGHGAGRGSHRNACAVQVLARAALADAERQRDLLVRAALELTQQQRVSLRRGQGLDGGERLAQSLAQFDDFGGLGGAGTIQVQGVVLFA
jgi:hypothetical protein